MILIHSSDRDQTLVQLADCCLDNSLECRILGTLGLHGDKVDQGVLVIHGDGDAVPCHDLE